MIPFLSVHVPLQTPVASVSPSQATFLKFVHFSFPFKVHRCSVPLGMEDRRIPGSAITASSSVNGSHGPSNAPLNFLNKGNDISAWCPKINSKNQWLQIDLREITAVTKVATQGRYNSEDRVTTYTLSYSVDGIHWAGYKQRAMDKVVLTEFVSKLLVCTSLDHPIGDVTVCKHCFCYLKFQ